jgi:hypothetical protein
LQIEEKRAGGVAGFEGFEGARGRVDDDGQFVVQVVRGGGGNGTGSVGVRQSFHTRMLAGERAGSRRLGGKVSLNSTKNKIMFV